MKKYEKIYRDLISYNPPSFDNKEIKSFDGENYESKNFIAYKVEYKIKYTDKDKIHVSGYDFLTEKDAETEMFNFFNKIINDLPANIANKHLQDIADQEKNKPEEYLSYEDGLKAFENIKRKLRGESFKDFFNSRPS